MKLWRLEPTNAEDSPYVGYDCVTLMVVRAETEDEARMLAAREAKDETPKCWLIRDWSDCEPFVFPTAEGDSEVVWLEFRPG